MIRASLIEPKEFWQDFAGYSHRFRVLSCVNFHRVGGFLDLPFSFGGLQGFFPCELRGLPLGGRGIPNLDVSFRFLQVLG
ncbi:hypothetical protein EJ110_NYTH04514 [Nymphaea thermarum]|nr:hypothetical protein EJ110_NYTH04514 [Nymphaea thermarum]